MITNFKINGVNYAVNLANLPPDITLNTFIREHAQLTATKFMCLEGGCGACVCAITEKNGKGTRTWATNSCLTLLNTCVDWEITTLEGIGDKRNGYHPLQKRLAKMNGTQCGFCSPGFVMNMYALLESKGGKVSMEEVENSFGGNICRCTGYRPILDAMKSFAADNEINVPGACESKDIEDLCHPNQRSLADRLCPDWVLCHKPLPRQFVYQDGSQWHWPKTLTDLFNAFDALGDDEYMLVGGNTAHGVYRRSHSIKHYIDLNGIRELKDYKITAEKLALGGGLALTDCMDILLKAASQPGFEYCRELWHHFDLIANVPVRNMGTIAGNISIKKANNEFPSDVFITFEALDVQVLINERPTVQKSMSLSDYIKAPMAKTVITAFELKAYPKEKYIFKSYKIMPRAQNAHAYVNAAFLLDMDVSTGMVNDARICFGGISPDYTHASSLETLIAGKNLFDPQIVQNSFTRLSSSLRARENLPDSSPEYRNLLASGLFYKFLLAIAPPDSINPLFRSGGELLKRPLSSGTQTFVTNEKSYPVTQPVEKLEALIQCSGEATYMNDVLTTSNAVYCAFVPAVKVGAIIEQIDASEALTQPGVMAFYSAKDIPGNNTFVDKSLDYEVEEIFCAKDVQYYGQPLGVIVALTSDIAHRAVDKVKVMYSSGAREVLPTMDDVIASHRKDRLATIVQSGPLTNKFAEPADFEGKGIFLIGSQYHFTMEPQTTIAVPFEEGLQIWSATQWMDQTQSVIAKMLQLKMVDVQLKVRRLGGGYGAKISRGNQVACAAALAAYKLQRPVRFVQSIESMMTANGKRWACRSDYEFRIKASGKILALENRFYEDAGCTLNENPVPGHSTFCAKNCYQLDESNFKLDANAVLTDAPSSTWCRAPGSLEGIAMIENILEHIAFAAKIDPADARLANIKPGHKMLELLPRFLKSTEYRQRRKEIDEYNSNNRWRKRGLGLAIMDYPIFYFGQYPATVSIYQADGTVVVTHGGIEMGQGLNTKVAQVAAHTFGIPLQMVKIESSDTISAANSSVTGGAVGSESLCYAVRKACNTLNERLRPKRAELKKDASWKEVVEAAFKSKINLIANDYYKVGDMQNYNVHGLAVTEMEVDIITGNNQIKRVDILEDAGESLSPSIDIGQIEGAFVMSLGYWLTEQLIYDRQTGQLLTNRTWNYKPPGAKDIPIDFRIELLQNNPNPAGFMRSKATGEPPSCLAVSTIFALQHAVQSARQDAGLKREWVRFGAPTTPEHIVLNSGNHVDSFSLK